MYSGAHYLTRAFPSSCEVRTCERAPQEWFDIDHHTFEVCHDHGLQLRAGEAYTVAENELRVGLDSTPELLKVRCMRTATGTILALELGHHGVIEQEVPMKVTPVQRAALEHMLHDSRRRDNPR